MKPFTTLTAVAAPLIRANVDTDAIIPSREMTSVSRTGLADGLFAGWRYTQIGGREPNPDFVLNQPAYEQARILLGGENFGCGSSREHAAWALVEYGFRAIIAPTFAPIFYSNCIRNGILPVRLPAADVAALAADIGPDPAARPITIDLVEQWVKATGGVVFDFEIGAEAREMLLEGLDPIDLTLRQQAAIDRFHERDRQARPWIYLDATAGER